MLDAAGVAYDDATPVKILRVRAAVALAKKEGKVLFPDPVLREDEVRASVVVCCTHSMFMWLTDTTCFIATGGKPKVTS